mgnify:CR=1 FL=1
MDFSLCKPAKLYIIIFLVMNILQSLFVVYLDVESHQKFKIYMGQFVQLVVNLLLLCIWTYFLNWLCSIGHTNISWILFWIPIAIIFLGSLLLLYYYLEFGEDLYYDSYKRDSRSIGNM